MSACACVRVLVRPEEPTVVVVGVVVADVVFVVETAHTGAESWTASASEQQERLPLIHIS